METLRIQFKNDDNVYEYRAQRVIDNIPYVANLTEEARKEIIRFPSYAMFIPIVKELPKDQQEEYTNKIHMDKEMFDAIITDIYETLLIPFNPKIHDRTQLYRMNAAKLLLTCACQLMLGIRHNNKVDEGCRVLMTQLLEGRQNLDYSPEESEERVKDYTRYMGFAQ